MAKLGVLEHGELLCAGLLHHVLHDPLRPDFGAVDVAVLVGGHALGGARAQRRRALVRARIRIGDEVLDGAVLALPTRMPRCQPSWLRDTDSDSESAT